MIDFLIYRIRLYRSQLEQAQRMAGRWMRYAEMDSEKYGPMVAEWTYCCLLYSALLQRLESLASSSDTERDQVLDGLCRELADLTRNEADVENQKLLLTIIGELRWTQGRPFPSDAPQTPSTTKVCGH